MNELELISFQIISAVGTAKSNYIEAMRLAEKGEFEKAEEIIKEGQKVFLEGHKAHAGLIQKEAAGETRVNPRHDEGIQRTFPGDSESKRTKPY